MTPQPSKQQLLETITQAATTAEALATERVGMMQVMRRQMEIMDQQIDVMHGLISTLNLLSERIADRWIDGQTADDFWRQ